MSTLPASSAVATSSGLRGIHTAARFRCGGASPFSYRDQLLDISGVVGGGVEVQASDGPLQIELCLELDGDS